MGAGESRAAGIRCAGGQPGWPGGFFQKEHERSGQGVETARLQAGSRARGGCSGEKRRRARSDPWRNWALSNRRSGGDGGPLLADAWPLAQREAPGFCQQGGRGATGLYGCCYSARQRLLRGVAAFSGCGWWWVVDRGPWTVDRGPWTVVVRVEVCEASAHPRAVQRNARRMRSIGGTMAVTCPNGVRPGVQR